MTANIFLVEGKIAIEVPYSDENLARAKSISGARWHKVSKTWRYPRSVETCLDARAAFGEELVVDPALAAWYVAEKSQREAQTALASQGDAELVRLPEVAPTLADALRPDQRAGAAWVAQGYRGAGLLADAPGTGKTIQVIAGLTERYAGAEKAEVLVTCPKVSVKNVWSREFAKWAPDMWSVHAARGTRQQREKALAAYAADPASHKVLIIVAEMTRIKEEMDPTREEKVFAGYEYPELFDRQWHSIVVDESQKWMGSLTVARGTLAGKGFKRLQQPAGGHRLAVSATPFGKGGRVQGMFGTLHWLWGDEFTSFWRWADRYFEIEQEEIYVRGGRGRTQTTRRLAGLKGGQSEEQFLASFGPRIMRRSKAEVLPWLPAKRYVEVLCEMTTKQERQYRQLSRDAEVRTDGGMVVANGTLAELTRAKQVANGEITVTEGGVAFTGDSGKLERLWQNLDARGILDGSGDPEGKLIIASQYNQFLDVVAAKLKAEDVPFHMLTGATSDARRDAAMDAFQASGGARVFLLNAKAGGVSITLDAADEVHCLDELWNPEDQEQLEDRAHRASRTHQVTIFYYRSEDTIDQRIAEDVEVKRRAQHNVLDGRRGLEYVRSMITMRGDKKWS